MERTISGMVGKGSVNRNTRAFTAKNVDSDRSGANIHFCNEDIKQVYNKLFDEAVDLFKKLWNEYANDDHGLYIGGKAY